jgi:hypothetical protein
MKAKDLKLSQRAVHEPTRLSDRGAGSHEEVASQAEAERLVPGAGEGFSIEWQRQFDLEEARQAAAASGIDIEDDTMFAITYDRAKEAVDEEQLLVLRQAMAELEAVELTEQMRANEAISLGSAARSQGLEIFRELQGQSGTDSCDVSVSHLCGSGGLAGSGDLRPKSGTKAHKLLTQIATFTSTATGSQASGQVAVPTLNDLKAALWGLEGT